MNTTTQTTASRSWGKPIILIHWITALSVFGLFALGLWMVDLTYYSDWYKTAPSIHKSVGIVLAALTLIRLVTVMLKTRPQRFGTRTELVLAKLAHIGIYTLLLLLFVSGYLISTADGRGIDVFSVVTIPGAGKLFDQQADIAGAIHFYVAWGLVGLAVMHAFAAIKHHVINKDDTLKQMLR